MEFESAAGRDVNTAVPERVGQVGDAPKLGGRGLAARNANAQHEYADLALRAHALRLKPIAILFGDCLKPALRQQIDVDGDAGRLNIFDAHRRHDVASPLRSRMRMRSAGRPETSRPKRGRAA